MSYRDSPRQSTCLIWVAILGALACVALWYAVGDATMTGAP